MNAKPLGRLAILSITKFTSKSSPKALKAFVKLSSVVRNDSPLTKSLVEGLKRVLDDGSGGGGRHDTVVK